MLPKFILLLLLALVFHSSNAMITVDFAQSNNCSSSPTYAPNSTYQTSLDNLFSTLVSNISKTDNGFLTYTSGKESADPVYGLVLCRGDVGLDECQGCVEIATQNVSYDCPMAKEAIMWMEECTLRYSYNETVISTALQEEPYTVLHNVNKITNVTRWTSFVGDMIREITSEAANGGDGKKYATKGEWYSPLATKVYSLAQCVPDLTGEDCTKCLNMAAENRPVSYQGGIVLTPDCSLRYEIYTFYDDLVVPSPPPISGPPTNYNGTSFGGKSHKNRGSLAIGISVGIVALILVALVAAFMCFRCKKRRQNENNAVPDNIMLSNHGGGGEEIMMKSSQYEFETLKLATNNFSADNKLGEGGFGGVYKGTLRNGQEVAIKRLSKGSNQGLEQFKNEAVFVAKLQHRNLVRLFGYCITSDEMLLVYEFLPCKSLDMILFDPKTQGQLGWPARYKIIYGIARGMSYLHEDSRLKIVHRDLKASNILLDADMNPKISDFGLAKHFSLDQEQDHTSRVAGTMGYMAPEYVESGQISTKSDVYSFGVLILEIVSGQKVSKIGSGIFLLSKAWSHWNEDTISKFVDSSLANEYTSSEVKRSVHIGLLCVQGNMELRPSMIQIVSYLSSNVDLATPNQPAYFMTVRMGSTSTTREFLSSDKSTSSVSGSTVQ